jgi:hypothetical protein
MCQNYLRLPAGCRHCALQRLAVAVVEHVKSRAVTLLGPNHLAQQVDTSLLELLLEIARVRDGLKLKDVVSGELVGVLRVVVVGVMGAMGAGTCACCPPLAKRVLSCGETAGRQYRW